MTPIPVTIESNKSAKTTRLTITGSFIIYLIFSAGQLPLISHGQGAGLSVVWLNRAALVAYTACPVFSAVDKVDFFMTSPPQRVCRRRGSIDYTTEVEPLFGQIYVHIIKMVDEEVFHRHETTSVTRKSYASSWKQPSLNNIGQLSSRVTQLQLLEKLIYSCIYLFINLCKI